MVFARVRSLLSVAVLLASSAFAYDNARSDNVVAYWGQNSYGASHGGDSGNWQKTLSYYCNDDSINVFPISFVHVFFGAGGLPSMDLSNICSPNGAVFPGSALPNCQFLASDIQTCQSKGKLITLSLGGATGATSFNSDAQATQFADTIWNLFLGGSSSTRPFGNAVLDGVDFDIESGTGQYYATFAKQLRSRMNGGSKKYYLTAAPQCVFPDAALGNVINSVGFDAIYVQFYNNWCGLQNYDNANAWNFNVWDNWAKTASPNKNVKVYIGAPASSTAANAGYVDINRLKQIALETKAKYSSFGGVMFWDASQAYVNGRFDKATKAFLTGGTVTPPTDPPPSTGCGNVAAWNKGTTYVGGNRASYNGRLWEAKWWTLGETPGSADVWKDVGACFAKVSSQKVDKVQTKAMKASQLSKFNLTLSDVEETERIKSRLFKAL